MMPNFGYTVLGFGAGKGDVPIAEDLTFSEVSDIADVQDDIFFALDPFNENRCLLVYRDDGTYGNDTQVVCGTLAADGNSITWGTVVEYDDEYGDVGSVDFDPNVENSFCLVGKFRVSNAHHHGARAGTISGTTITLGSTVYLDWATASDYISGTTGKFNPAQAGQFIVVDGNFDGANGGGDYNQGEIKVLTISGTTITHVSSAIFEPISTFNPRIEWDNVTANKGYLVFAGGSNYPAVRPFTMSGNTVTLGTKHVVNSSTSNTYQMGTCMETGGRLAVIYKTGNDIDVVIGNDDSTAASGTITWGTAVEVANYSTEGSHLLLYPTVCADKNTPNKLLMGYNIPVTSSSSRWRVGTVSGTNTISIAGGYTHILASTATPDINKNIVSDPHNPGLFYTSHSHTGDSSKPKIVGSQVASFEL